MCGLLGQYNCSNKDRTNFSILLTQSAHRGPDQTGIWAQDRIMLGFNRLAILDLTEAGHQPMLSPNKQYAIVFNGEIYNHLELRRELPKQAYRGSSDTETVTHALDYWGVQATVEALDGMFALAIYELFSGKLYLVRGFAGIKPLYFGQSGKAVVFASQYDQVRQHPLFKDTAINPQALKLYLKQHFMPAPFGLHEGIEQVRPGELIQFDISGKRSYIRYWELPDYKDAKVFDADKANQMIGDGLRNSVKDQLLSDVPLGAFLSGGVDSPLVCSYAGENNKGFKVFSIGSDSKIHDESVRSQAIAEALDLKQYLWKLRGNEILNYWEEAMQALHEPLADFSIFPTYLISKLAKKEVTVALSGDGGDELFFGYERFWSIGKNLRFQHWPKIARMGLYALDKYYSGNKNLNSVLLADHQSKAHEGLHSRFKDNWINQIFPDLHNIALPEEWNVYSYTNQKDITQLLSPMRKAEFYGMMQKTLRKVDLASMQNSLEVRVPFLQKKFIELALRIDPQLSYGKNQKKQVLKNILSNRLPQIKDDNVKRGFTIPLGEWIKKDLKPVFSDTLLSDNMKTIGAEQSAIEMMLNEHITNAQSHKWALFTLFALSKNL